MDQRKRPRLEMVTTNGATFINRGQVQQQNFYINQSIAGEDVLRTTTTTRKATTSTNNNNANVYLAICDDHHSNESQAEFITIENRCSIEQNTTTTTTTAAQRGVNVGLSAINAQTAATLLPASVQLPSGCEIYLVKEYLEMPPLTPTNAPRTVISSTKTTTTAAIKSTTTTTNEQKTAKAINTKNCLQIVRKTIPNNNNNNNINDANDRRTDFEKQSELLEAYKKRDDKRRATHNEVERRRRDKINSWIFKLKEMLPAEIPNYTAIENESSNNNSNSNSSTSDQQFTNSRNNSNNSTVCRNLPCDSKSQILIKACEYIKSMQLELKSMREYILENETLRCSNERLQNELNQLKNVQITTGVVIDDDDEEEDNDDNDVISHCNGHLSVHDSDDAVDGHVDDLTHNLNSNPNSNFNVTLNSLNNISGNGDSLFMPTTTTANNLVSVVDTKGELMMRDFVD